MWSLSGSMSVRAQTERGRIDHVHAYTAGLSAAELAPRSKAARKLEASGMDRTQAEAVAQTMRDAAGADLDRVVTKAALYQVALAIVIANAAKGVLPGAPRPRLPPLRSPPR